MLNQFFPPSKRRVERTDEKTRESRWMSKRKELRWIKICGKERLSVQDDKQSTFELIAMSCSELDDGWYTSPGSYKWEKESRERKK